tara:strand:- start:744 stop:956 length:213 start_codon:yes stop_codon:yes gene_type:complete
MSVNEFDFCQLVEKEAEICDSYITAVINSCESFDIDFSSGAKLLSKPLIEKIQQEGEDSNLLPKISKLPI